MKLLCLFKHKYAETKRIKGVIKGNFDVTRGIFITYECSRCKKKIAEFISIADRKTVQPEYIEAYTKEEKE